MIKIKEPYINAFLMPALREVAFLVKKETVKGIIGNTQGVSKATKPPRNPIKNKAPNPLDFVLVTA
jgi:hypothetical protein